MALVRLISLGDLPLSQAHRRFQSMAMNKKRALICGASQGIGKACWQSLAEQGYETVGLARSEESLASTLAELPGEGHQLLAVDLSKMETWKSAVEDLIKSKSFDVLICNAGGPPSGPISQAAPEDFLQAMNLHLVTNSILTSLVLPGMKEKGFGRILTITSTSVKVPIPHLGVSNTVRAAVASWGKTLSIEVAPFGVTVNNIMPGFTETPRLSKLIKAKSKNTGQTEEQVIAAWKKMVPLGRFCRPEETANLVQFLCSNKADAITGQNIAVDGGRLGCL